MSNIINIYAFSFDIKRWDVIKVQSSGQIGVVIKKTEGVPNGCIITVYPCKRKKTRFGSWLFIQILKLKIFLGIIKTH